MRTEYLLTDYCEIDAAVARGRALEIDAAPVQSGVRFSHVVDHETGGLLERVEVGALAEHLVVGPRFRPVGVLVASVVPVRSITRAIA